MHQPSNNHGSYHRPVLERFGSFRELTLTGLFGNMDGGLILNPDTPTTSPAADLPNGNGRS